MVNRNSFELHFDPEKSNEAFFLALNSLYVNPFIEEWTEISKILDLIINKKIAGKKLWELYKEMFWDESILNIFLFKDENNRCSLYVFGTIKEKKIKPKSGLENLGKLDKVEFDFLVAILKANLQRGQLEVEKLFSELNESGFKKYIDNFVRNALLEFRKL